LDDADEGGSDQTAVRTEAFTGDGRIDVLLLNEVGKRTMIVEIIKGHLRGLSDHIAGRLLHKVCGSI
jgi:hypothetical protein